MLTASVALALVALQHWYLQSRLREQERIQDELRASEGKFSGILSIAADAIITVDQSQRIIHFNRGAEEIFGHSASDAIGRHLAILLPARYRASHDTHMERFAQSAVTARRMGERREIFGLRADGTEFPAEASISKLVARDGILFTVVLRDITRQKRAEEDERFLAAASTELAQTLDVDATLATIVDLAVPHLADASFLDIVESGDTLRRSVSTRQRAELTPAIQALGAHRLTYDSPSPIIDAIRRNRIEYVHRIDDEWIEMSADPEAIPHWAALGARSLLILPLHASGETIGALTLVSTSTEDGFPAERRAVAEKYAAVAATTLENARLYVAAQQANSARDEILSVVSHDLRNPISAIQMCSRALDENPPTDDSARRELITTIRESASWMNRLIQDLVDVASIERGRLSLVRETAEPAQLVLQARHMFEIEAAQHRLALNQDVPTNLPLVQADSGRVVQVLGNLVRNAIKFTPDGGTVTIGVRAESGMLVFFVRDSGVGITRERQARVFDRYWQAADGARSRGSGLGLSIAKGIVEAHGGSIWLESAPGSGTTFFFSLPSVSKEA